VLRPVSKITIGNFQFDYVTNVNIKSSWDTFTDTASITLPNKFKDRNGKSIVVGANNVFQRGDEVEIKLGYFPNLTTKFKGVISKIIPDSPLIIECEDKMWLLKQVNLDSRSFKKATIKDVVDYAAASLTGLVIEYDTPTVSIGGFEIDNKNFVNAVKIFEVLKKQFGFHIYFVDDKLQVKGMNSIIALNNPVHRFGFQQNIINSTLEYVREDDINIVIKAESIKADNTRIVRFGFKQNGKVVVTATPKAGEMRALLVYNFTASELETEVRRNIDRFIYEGYAGNFTTFLEPAVSHSDRVDLIDNKHVEREGRYLIRTVESNFGINGARQVISLKNKISA